MKKVSIDNGNTFVSPSEAVKGMDWDTIVNYMDDDKREEVAFKFAPCADVEFLTEYLKIANDDLIIG